jgi:hypothetical protein
LQAELNRPIAALRHGRAISTERLRALDRFSDATLILQIANLAKSLIRSCIAATLAARLRMNRALHWRHRLYFTHRKLKMISQDEGRCITG